MSTHEKHSPLEELRKAIAAFVGENPPHVAIILHKNPDPDCIGSALGVKKLLSSFNPLIKCSIVYSGEISHPQNKTMVNILNLSLIRSEDIDLKTFADFYMTVDFLPEREPFEGIKFIMAIDHHKGDSKKAQIKDIRQVGATATIVWDYLTQCNIVLDKTNAEDADIATALFIGIKTDTQDLVSDNTTDLDFQAYRGLLNSIDQRKMQSIDRYPIPNYHFELRKRLDQEGNTLVDKGVFIGGIGYITPSKRDALPTIADERARVEGIDVAFVYAIVGDHIDVSVRCNSLAIDVNTLCQNLFGKNCGGGKMGAGAARVAMGFLSIEDNEEEVQEKMWVAVREKMKSRILEIMSEYR